MIKKVTIAIVIVLAAGIGFYIWKVKAGPVVWSDGYINVAITPTLRETEEWQTYASEKYGYEIQYPSTFVLRQDREDGADVIQHPIDKSNFVEIFPPSEQKGMEINSVVKFRKFVERLETIVAADDPALDDYTVYLYPVLFKGIDSVAVVDNSQPYLSKIYFYNKNSNQVLLVLGLHFGEQEEIVKKILGTITLID